MINILSLSENLSTKKLSFQRPFSSNINQIIDNVDDDGKFDISAIKFRQT